MDRDCRHDRDLERSLDFLRRDVGSFASLALKGQRVNVYRSSNPDRLLARGRQDGAVGELLDLYRGYLKVLARMQIGSRLQGKVDASDAVQEVFLRAYRGFREFQGGTERELLGWLRKILSRVLADLTRQFYGARRRDVRLEREMDQHLDRSSQVLAAALAAVQSTPSEQAVRKEQAVLLAEAIEQLPEDYREVIIMRHLEQLGFAEVAQRMDRSLDSVKNLWARALARLQQTLTGVQ